MAGGCSPAPRPMAALNSAAQMHTPTLRKMFRLVKTVSAALVLLALAYAEAAIAAVTGKIAGTITDPSGAGIPRVSVSLTNTMQGTETKVTADEHGDYIFPIVPVGTYDILLDRKSVV